jgi:hypothetical protein
MPTIVTRGAASARGFGAFASLGAGYWILSYYKSASTTIYGPSYINGSGQYVSLGITGSKTGFLTLSKKGALVSQTVVSSGMDAYDNSFCSFDSTNNYLYYAGRISTNDAGYVKMVPGSSPATLTKGLTPPFSQYIGGRFYSVNPDSSQNVYTSGFCDRNTGCCIFDYYGIVAKFNSSGTPQWSKYMNIITGGYTEFLCSILNSSQNPIVCGYGYEAAGGSSGSLISFDSSGTILWQRKLSNSTNYIEFDSVLKDSSDNYYVAGRNGNNSNILFVKYNSSGVIQFQRAFSGLAAQGLSYATIDSSSNVYIVNVLSGNNGIILLKYDSSGNLQWQRQFKGQASPLFGLQGTGQIFLDPTDSAVVIPVYATGSTLASDIRLVIKYPTSGSITGTYTVAGRSLTISASSGTSSTISYTDAAGNMTDRGFTGTGVNPAATTYTTASNSTDLTTL